MSNLAVLLYNTSEFICNRVVSALNSDIGNLGKVSALEGSSESGEGLASGSIFRGAIDRHSNLYWVDPDCELAQDEETMKRIKDTGFTWEPFLLGYAYASKGEALTTAVLKGDSVTFLTRGSFRTPDYYRISMEPVTDSDGAVVAASCKMERVCALTDSRFQEVVPICSSCKKIRVVVDGNNQWSPSSEVFDSWDEGSFLNEVDQVEYLTGCDCSHGMCRECFEDYYPGEEYFEG